MSKHTSKLYTGIKIYCETEKAIATDTNRVKAFDTVLKAIRTLFVEGAQAHLIRNYRAYCEMADATSYEDVDEDVLRIVARAQTYVSVYDEIAGRFGVSYAA